MNIKHSRKCVVCDGEENNLMVVCENCEFWVHYSCARLVETIIDQVDK